MQIRQWLQDINSSLVCAAIDCPPGLLCGYQGGQALGVLARLL